MKLFWSLLLALLVFTGAWATEPSNGDFETGDLTDWTDYDQLCDPADELCNAEVTTGAKRNGDYGLLVELNSEGGPGSPSSNVRWLRGDDHVTPPSEATTVTVFFYLRADEWPTDDGWSENYNARCNLSIFQEDAGPGAGLYIGYIWSTSHFTYEMPEYDILNYGLPEDEWRGYSFSSDLDGLGDVWIQITVMHDMENGTDGPVICHYDDIAITWGR